jgi:hypothetical protein
MASHIPFINTADDCDIFKAHYTDSPRVRVTLDRIEDLAPLLPSKTAYWLDCGFDGFHHKPDNRADAWKNYVSQYTQSECFNDANFIAKPDRNVVLEFVDQVLNAALQYSPQWISIPQLPVRSVPANTLNRLLTEASGRWRSTKGFSGSLILPVIFTHQSQLNGKTSRNKVVEQIRRCLEKAPIDGIWCVDSSLCDQDGTQNFEKQRFHALVCLLEEIIAACDRKLTTIAGPYWGMNLVLWARGLADNPAVALGRGYQYHLSAGKPFSQAKDRLALVPLRRWAVASPELKDWFAKVSSKIAPRDPAYVFFAEMSKQFSKIGHGKPARMQVAEFYKKWFTIIEKNPPAGRALALYQDLSSAYVMGKNLPDLPKSEDSARRPERVAQQLMLNCL